MEEVLRELAVFKIEMRWWQWFHPISHNHMDYSELIDQLLCALF